ncbi:hypothetical protein CDD80_4558 [Ophiocordyceps camponoti-rufipedis]|uniref:Uncharacterized protein n=1 Tax=Ophiocordyceps camponoti-rufipedis TaxID=2004952 RepID=A0A2C5YSA5_9HYPO|nr:hypothetical protein CDD80_4558 [Ophiocordyceps camponoti-rufipedis]
MAADKYDQYGSLAGVVSSPTHKPTRPGLKTSRTGDGRTAKTMLTAHNVVRMMPVTSDGASSSRASRSVGKGGSSSSLEGGRHEALALMDLKSPSRQLIADKEERIIRVCHSCGEDLSSRSRCNKCGHDFCNKCVIKITMDNPPPEAPHPSSSTSTIREPLKRDTAPETPKTRPTQTQVGAGVRNNPFFKEDQKTRALTSEPRTVPFARTAVRTRQLSDCVPRRFMDRASSDGPEDEEEEEDERDHQHSICCEARQRRAERRSMGPETDVEDDDDRGSRKIRNLRLRAEELHVRQKKIRDEDEASIAENEDAVHDDAASYSLRPRPHRLEEDERVPVDVTVRPHSLERDDVFVGFGGISRASLSTDAARSSAPPPKKQNPGHAYKKSRSP